MVEKNDGYHNAILIVFKESLDIEGIAMLSLSSPCCLDSRCEFRSTLDILDRNLFGPLLPSRTDARKHQLLGESLFYVSCMTLRHRVVASNR